MIFSVQAKHLPPINLVVSIRLAVYNSKSSKPNRSVSPFRKEDLTTLKSSHPASLMAHSFTRCSPRQNPHNGKDELAGGTPTKDSNRCTPTPAATRALFPAIAPVVALLVASGSTNSSMVRFSEDNLQQILRTILDFRLPALVLAPIITAAPHYEGPRERPLKAWFPDIY